MRIYKINSGINFGRAMAVDEQEQAKKLQKEAMDYLGVKKVITIIPEPSFPVESQKNAGQGHLNSEITGKFLDFWKLYTGATDIKVLPLGEVKPHKSYYGSYRSSALTLGINTINPSWLAEEEMGKILSEDTLKSLYDIVQKSQTVGFANFENTVGNESALNKALQEAFENFKNFDSPIVKELRKEFETYKAENKQVVEGRALYETLSDIYKSSDVKKWNETDKNLFNPDIVSIETRNARIDELAKKYFDSIEFCYFKQFLADKGLKKAKENMNQKDIQLVGDCLIAFSRDEIWSHPKAFLDANIASKDWGLRALDFASLSDENSEASNLLKLKVSQFAKRYDSIRFDVGWSYINPVVYPHKNVVLPDGYVKDPQIADGYRVKEYLGEKALKMIEKTVLGVKGENYNLDNLMYEIEAAPSDFTAFNWNKMYVIPELKNRTIVQSGAYMSNTYATVPFMENTMNVQRKNYVFMAGNHDNLALNAFARGVDNDDILKGFGNNIYEVRNAQYEPLARDLRLDAKTLSSNPKEFVKAKFAYNFLAENIKMFFMDIFGRSEQFDSQNKNSFKNYRYMIPENYEESLHTSIQDGNGFNIFDALYKAVKAKDTNNQKSKLTDELKKYAQILYENGAKTESEANVVRLNELLKESEECASKKPVVISVVFAVFLVLGILCGSIFSKKDKAEKQS